MKEGNDVHFNGAAYVMLAGKVADAVLEALAEAGQNSKRALPQGARH